MGDGPEDEKGNLIFGNIQTRIREVNHSLSLTPSSELEVSVSLTIVVRCWNVLRDEVQVS